MDPLGLAGILVTLLIALWQSHEATKAKKQLDNYLKNLPEVLVANISERLNASSDDNIDRDRLVSPDHRTSTMYADLDNDGNDELIVEFPIGAHGSAVQIYKLAYGGPELLAEWSTDVPYGFELDRSDPTYSPLLQTGETNRSSGLPYVMGLRDTVWLRLKDGKLEEYRRDEPSEQEIAEKIQELKDHGSAL